ncbi:MAG: LEA type 2 family protein [Pseudomonadota bacterium]
MKTLIQGLALIAGTVLLSACTSFGSGFEPPVVNLQSFRALPAEGNGMTGLPTFEIGLQVLNPTPETLRLEGVFYTIGLEGQSLLSGVANDLPEIEGYGEGTVTLTASVSVLGGMRLLQQLLNEPKDEFSYTFSAKLDPVGFGRTIRVEEHGEISLTGE